MSVSNDPTPLQSVLRQLGAVDAAPAARAAEARNPATRNDAPAARAEAAPRVRIPEGATSLDPNAPRGTYLNLVV